MDRLIYLAMTGARNVLAQQATNSHNLANISTPGFRAQLDAFRAVPVVGALLPTRTYAVDATVGTDFRPGVIQTTGRPLDVAINGRGWIAVQAPDGSEAYTRNGSLQLTANGVLQTRDGFNVLSDAGPISVPPDTELTIAKDGTLSTVPGTNQKNQLTEVGRIKLVNPPEGDLVRGEDGLFRLANGGRAPADDTVFLHVGALETSNVNPAEILVSLISLQRQFDMQMKLLQNAEQNAAKAAALLNLNG
ncbi:MAG: flagellar basal body rod protein FlgF [Burkholderiales bacterium]|jgi:flagellar basal-body rod protein FlgF|nr:flagellar basal body rod protein FlgF [Burkholderiales bacterium]